MFHQHKEITRLLNRRRASLRQQRPEFQPRQIEHTRDGDTLELLIYGVIGDSWWSDSVSAIEVAELLAEHRDAEQIDARINSVGGDVFDGVAIFNLLDQHAANVTTIVDGIAASAASIILQAGDTRRVGEMSQVMIHRAWTFAMGNAGELTSVAEILEKIDEQAIALYAQKSGLDVDQVRDLLIGEGENDGTWFSAEEAIDNGFADLPASDDDEPTTAAAAANSINFSQLGELRVAALYQPFGASAMPPKKPDNEQPVDADVVDETPDTPAATADEPTADPPATDPVADDAPQAATFDELVELAGDDNEFIVEQQKSGATLTNATKAYIERLKAQQTAAEQSAADACKRAADMQAAAGGDEEADPVSATPQSTATPADNHLKNALGDRLGGYAASLTLKTAEQN